MLAQKFVASGVAANATDVSDTLDWLRVNDPSCSFVLESVTRLDDGPDYRYGDFVIRFSDGSVWHSSRGVLAH